MKKIVFLLLFAVSLTKIIAPLPLETAMAKTKGWGRFAIRKLAVDPQTGKQAYSYVTGKVIALYDQRAKDFCGTLLYDKKKGIFALSTTERDFNTFPVEPEEIVAFFQDNPNIVACEVPSYLSTQKKTPLFFMGGAVILGSLLVTLGVVMAKRRIREIRAENGGKGVVGQLAMDTGWALTKIILMAMIESIIDQIFGFRAPVFPVLGGALYGKSDFVLPIIGGTVLGGIPAAILIKKLFFSCYRSPLEAITAAQAALAKAKAKAAG